MRKIYLTLAAAALSLGLSAQVQKSSVVKHSIDISNIKQVGNSSQAVKSNSAVENFFVDYSAANFDDLFYVWTFNSNYTATDTQDVAPINYAAVGLTGPLAGYSDPNDVTGTWLEYPYYFNPVTIDSIFVILTHENNSGTYDKIKMQIVTLDGTNKPTDTVLWEQVDSSNVTLSSGGNWLGSGAAFVNAYAPAFTTTDGQKIGFNLRYEGSKADTFAIIGGSVDDGNGGTTEQSNYQNSWLRIAYLGNNKLQNANIGYGNPVGSGGWFEAQNWGMFAYVTYNVTDVTENEFIKGVKIGQSFPNPADKATRFFYELQKPSNVSFDVYDMSGRLVKQYNEGVKEAGKHTHVIDVTSLTSGVYFYTIKTDATTITKRFVVTK